MDGDARGGAALSIRSVTGIPIKFIGTGERMDALEPFYPDRLASRILGMGDVLSLIERAQEQTSEEEREALEARLMEGHFDLEDFLNQLQSIKKMGPLTEVLGMIPGIGSALRGQDVEISDDEFKHVEAIIHSMTPQERRYPDIINKSRRDRIARGSGTEPDDVRGLLKQFTEMQKMMSQMGLMAGGGGRKGKRGMMSRMPGTLGQIGDMRDLAKEMQRQGIDPNQLSGGMPGSLPPGMGGFDLDAMMGGAPLTKMQPAKSKRDSAGRKQQAQRSKKEQRQARGNNKRRRK
jgi:signal recognition particle subunit SRP54